MTSCTKVLWTVLIAGGLAGLCLPGCGSKQPNTGGGKQPARRAARILTVPSDEECRQFAATVEEAVQSHDIEAFNAAIDLDALLESVTGGIEGAEKVKSSFIAGVKQRYATTGGFGKEVVQPVAEGGSYRFLRVHVEGRQKRVLFRILSADGKVNYHDMIVSRQPDGRIKAVDIFVYFTSETLSKTFRRSFIAFAADASKGVLDRLTGKESDLVKNTDKLGQMNRAMRQGQYQRVLDTYGQLPPSLKKDKIFLLLRFKAATEMGEAEYIAAINDFRKWHPEDPCLDLISLDQLIIEKRYDEALASVKRLEAALGPDPYLNFMRADIKIGQNRLTEAKQLANDVIEADDTLIEPYWALITVSLTEKDFDETNRLLNTLENRFLVGFGDLKDVPLYAEYVKSPQYRKWMASREQK